MCDRAETPISVDGILMGDQDTVSAGEVLDQVRVGMRKLGVEKLAAKIWYTDIKLYGSRGKA